MAWPFRNPFRREEKASQVGALISASIVGRPAWPKRDFALAAQEGYLQNPIVRSCVDRIARSVASIPIDIVKREGQSDGAEVDVPELAALLNRPRPGMRGAAFRENLIVNFLVGGNAFIERVNGLGGKPIELWIWRNDRTRVVPGPQGMPEAYEFTASGGTRRLPVDLTKPDRMPVLHWKNANPTDDWYGTSPIDGCAYAIDAYTAAEAWNKASLDNGARPSGALVYKPPANATNLSLGPDQFDRLKRELENYRGAANSGKPMLLDGGLEWQQISLSPKDMDFQNLKDSAARTIAITFGVPPMLLGIPGDNTYSNYQEANKAFYRDTVIPLAKAMCEELSAWICPAFGQGIEIEPDCDDLFVFADEREAFVAATEESTVLTVNEKREARGFDPRPEGDVILSPSSMIPLEDAGATITSPDGRGDPEADAEDPEDPAMDDAA